MDQFVELWLPAVSACMAAALVALALAAWRYIKQIGEERQNEFVRALVLAAEQTFAGESGAAKYDWVVGQILAFYPEFDLDLANVLIESVVASMNRAGRGSPQ